MKKFLIILFAQILAISIFSLIFYKLGWNFGASRGVSVALDTVKNILEDQMKSDTSVTDLIIENGDTSRYIISRKTLIK